MLLKLNKEGPFKKDVFRAPGHQVCSLSLKIGQNNENPVKNTWKPKTPFKSIESIGKLVLKGYSSGYKSVLSLKLVRWLVFCYESCLYIRQRVSSVVTHILNLLIMNHV